MVKPGFLENDDVIAWLDGVEPAWCYLDFTSYCRLRSRPDDGDCAMRLAALFGLLEAYPVAPPTDRFLPIPHYRKSVLYDRFLSFDVVLEPIDGTRH